MDALKAILNRVSAPVPGMVMPRQDILNNIFLAALRAPDHRQLKPWRFLLIKDAARSALGELFVQAKLSEQPEMTASGLKKVRQKPLRAPLIVVVIACLQNHPGVPEVEQILSAGAAVQNMLLAAHVQGAGAMWRTGSMSYHPLVLSGLGLKDNERLIGYLYIGSAPDKNRAVPKNNTGKYFSLWPEVK